MGRRRIVVLAACFLAGLALAGVIAASGVGPFGDDEQPRTLRVMTFNVFYGGDDYDLVTRDWCETTNGCPRTLDQVVAAIEASGADIVGLEEGEGNTQVIADRLGWHASPRTQIVSRYPLLDPPGANGAYVLALVAPGRVVAVSSVHLPSDPYGPYAHRDGATAAKLDALERATRFPMLTERLRALEPLLTDDEMPVFLVGDFNSPSHLDWTEAIAAERDVVRYAYEWPVSQATTAEGFRDSYREAHPDPVARPGFTWTPGGPEQDKREVHDRIDWVLVAGPAETTASEILGENGGPDVEIEAGDPFPSDHRGVVSTFTVTPAPSPELTSLTDRNVEVGEPAVVSYHAGGDGELVVVRAGAAPSDRATVRAPATAGDGTVRISTARLAPGPYDVVLVVDGDEVSRSSFWLTTPGAPPEIGPIRPVYRSGAPISVRWRAMPGNRWDWIGLFKATTKNVPTDGTIADDAYDYLFYEYTDTKVAGTGAFTAASSVGSGTWPLPPGRYELRLLLDDGYVVVARSQPFSVE